MSRCQRSLRMASLLQLYYTAEEAAKVYDSAAIQLRGPDMRPEAVEDLRTIEESLEDKSKGKKEEHGRREDFVASVLNFGDCGGVASFPWQECTDVVEEMPR